MVKTKLKVAVVGLGKMGLLHASLLHSFPQVELVAICDKSPLLIRIAKKIFSSTGVNVVADVEKLNGQTLDAVYVTTPILSHSPIIKNLLTKNITKNVFSEKTLAFNYAQSKDLAELAQKTGGTTMVGYMKRFNVVFEKTKQLLDQKVLGETQSFKAFAYSSDFQGFTKESKSSVSRGGALRDIGCHIIDLSIWLMGDFEVDKVTSCLKSEEDAEISAAFNVSMPLDIKGTFDVSQCMSNYRLPEFGLLIECEKGKIDVNDDRLIITSNDGSQKNYYKQDLNDGVPFCLGEAEYYRENQLFLDSITHHRQATPNFHEASKVDRIIEDVKSKEGKQ